MRQWFLAAILIIVGAHRAHADWEFTRWGMTVDDVLRASKGTAQALSPEQASRFTSYTDYKTMAVIPSRTVAGLQFRVEFGFSPDGRLVQQLGQPQAEARGGIPNARWNDPRRHNSIRLLKIASLLMVQYSRPASGF